MPTYGSDVAIRALAGLGIDMIAFNPGASFRGLHESLVHLGLQHPVLCLSEGVAVAVAHGFAKASGRPMGVFLHNLVGLQSGSMALFNAWIDRAPMLVIGGSGPADRDARRPWIDWIHTASPQGAVVRDWVKWDHEPASIAGLLSSMSRAHEVCLTEPQGPVYLALDALLQEAEVVSPDLEDLASSPPRMSSPLADLEEVADTLARADRPVIVADLVGRSRRAYDALIELSDASGARVVDLGGRHNFPNTHPNDASGHRATALGDADVALLLDVRDPGWALCEVDARDRSATPLVGPGCEVVDIGLSALLNRGFVEPSSDVPKSSLRVIGDTAEVLPTLVTLMRERIGDGPRRTGSAAPHDAHALDAEMPPPDAPIDDDILAWAVFAAVRDGPWQLAHGLMRGAVRRHWRLDRFAAHLGGSGGAGLGYGVGASIGAALAAPDGQLTVALQPDGDLLYTPSALWTAAHERLPLLIVVVNNRRYAQDHMHQSIMSRVRGRPLEHAKVGIDIEDPAVDFAALASAQGVEGIGPVHEVGQLVSSLEHAVRVVRDEGRPVLVDVEVAR